MALIECPDCTRKVSDRADHCPDCHCPVKEVVAERRAAEERVEIAKTRKHSGREVDCPRCEARGFYKCEDETGEVEFCAVCEETGRVQLCEASDGFYAVAGYAVDRFVSGELYPETSGVVFFIGKRAPAAFRYPTASERHPPHPDDIPWEIEPEKE
jgi:hypothetical protein